MGHLSAIVASVAVVPATASWSLRKRRPLSAAVLAHVALSGFCVAIAASEHFAVHTHAMLGKRTTGSISPIGILLFWPYHVSLRSKLWVQRHFLDREPVFNAITDGWYLGGWPASQRLLPQHGDNLSILDCTCELPYKHKRSQMPYHNLPIWDTYGPKSDSLNAAVLWAAEQRKAGRSLLVHCAHGHGRSTLVMCASFIHLGLCRDPTEALAMIKAQRPSVGLNKRQLQALNDWAHATGRPQAIVDPVRNADD